jgi:hypothetical protein
MQMSIVIRVFLTLIVIFFFETNADAQSLQCSPAQDNVGNVICDHVILLHEYENIQTEQQQLVNTGKLSTADLFAWRQSLTACEDVHCVDAIFATWKEMASKIASNEPIGDASQSSITSNVVAGDSEMASTPRFSEDKPVIENDQSPQPTQPVSSSPTPPPESSMTSDPQSSMASPRTGNLWMILLPMFAIGSAMLGKRDKRYKTGIKGNPSRLRRFVGLLVIALAFAILMKYQ